MTVKLSEVCKKCGREVCDHGREERLCYSCYDQSYGCQHWEFNDDGTAKIRIRTIDSGRYVFIGKESIL